MKPLFILLLFFSISITNVGAMEIFIERSGSPTFTLEVEGSDSVQNVKQKIQDREGFPPNQQILMFNGVTLEDNRTLSFYSIQAQDTLQLTLNTLSNKTTESIDFGIYPNPFDSSFSIELNNKKDVNYTIVSIAGKVIKTGNLSNGTNPLQFTHEASGLYFIKLQDYYTDQSTTKKIIKN